MGYVSHLSREDLGKYIGLEDVIALSSKADVATLLETYKHTVKEIGYKTISGVVQDDEGYYYFIDEGVEGDFSLYPFINSRYSGEEVNCLNANLLYPKSISRGMFMQEDEVEVSKVSEEDDEEEDTPTSYLDESFIDIEPKVYTVRNVSKGISYIVPEEGIVVGRSAKQSDFIIKGNTNVGRAHCKIYIEDNLLKVADLGSTNGTFINKERVFEGKDKVLSVGDTLYLADEEFIVE